MPCSPVILLKHVTGLRDGPNNGGTAFDLILTLLPLKSPLDRLKTLAHAYDSPHLFAILV